MTMNSTNFPNGLSSFMTSGNATFIDDFNVFLTIDNMGRDLIADSDVVYALPLLVNNTYFLYTFVNLIEGNAITISPNISQVDQIAFGSSSDLGKTLTLTAQNSKVGDFVTISSAGSAPAGKWVIYAMQGAWTRTA